MAKVQKGAADAAAKLIAKYGKSAVSSAVRNFKPAKAVKVEPGLKQMKKVLGNKKLSGTQGGRPVTYTGPAQSKNVKSKVEKTTIGNSYMKKGTSSERYVKEQSKLKKK